MTKPGFFRIAAAIVYDFILLVASLFFATALLLPLNGGEAFAHNQIFYPVFLLAVSFAFYGWFWTHGGQTLGLRAWKLKLFSSDFKPVTWYQAFIRFIVAILSWSLLGLGFLWIIIDKKQRTWHDVASKTGLYVVDKK